MVAGSGVVNLPASSYYVGPRSGMVAGRGVGNLYRPRLDLFSLYNGKSRKLWRFRTEDKEEEEREAVEFKKFKKEIEFKKEKEAEAVWVAAEAEAARVAAEAEAARVAAEAEAVRVAAEAEAEAACPMNDGNDTWEVVIIID